MQNSSKNEEYLHLNKFIEKTGNNVPILGVWITVLDVEIAVGLVEYNKYPNYKESLSKTMIDFVLIEMEHRPYDIKSLREFIFALNSKQEILEKGNLQPNITTLVRIPAEGNDNVKPYIKQVLDVGAHGVVVPHVRSVEEVQKIVNACRYPHQPDDSAISGKRGASPRICSYIWGLSNDEYIKRADLWPLNPKGDLLLFLMIEDKMGVKNCENIIDVEGVSGLIFGPYDYSFDIGVSGDINHPEVIEAGKKVREVCYNKERIFIGFATPDNITDRIEDNYRALIIGGDAWFRPTIDSSFENLLNYIDSKNLI